jgi:cell division protein FtsI/penicillin-binding protein 2
MKSKYLWRIRILSVSILLISLLLIAKLYFVQIVNGASYRERADHQYVQPNQYIFDRGTIFFQNKDGSLFSAATVKSGFNLIMNPKLVTNAEVAYQKLSALITLDHSSFIAKSVKPNDSYEALATKVESSIGQQISSLKIPGISLSLDKWRFYPGNDLASHVLGLVGFSGSQGSGADTLAGRYGLESYYEDTLKRSDDSAYVNFFAEIFSDLNKTITQQSSLEGDIVSTIEPNVQIFLQRQLDAVEAKWHSDLTGGIVIDPKTGEIYAMAATPTFDPNNLQSQKSPAVFTNPMVENVYEMGSIVKALTMSAGLDAGVITPETTYDDTGSIIVDGKKISNYDGKARGKINMQEILNQSLNVGAAHIMHLLGIKPFSDYLRNFGLGEKTGIDLPNEATGLLNNLNSPREVEHSTASFGQGIAISPIETVRALSALANNGVLPTPHIIKQINYKLGFSKTLSFPPGRQVIKASTAATISQMLVHVVDTALAKGAAKQEHYSIAAKTGTAQISAGKAGYYSDRYLHSFFGYFPAFNPRFLVFYFTYYPRGAQYASNTLTDPFINTTKFLINYYEIPPDR